MQIINSLSTSAEYIECVSDIKIRKHINMLLLPLLPHPDKKRKKRKYNLIPNGTELE